jgi:hypothetical protein
MTIAFGSYADSSATFGNSLSMSIPVGTTGVLVLVMTTDASPAATAVTVGGSATAQLGSTIVSASGELLNFDANAWLLASGAPSGTQTIAATGATDGETLICVYTLTTGGGLAMEMIDTGSVNSASQANPTDTLTLLGRTCFCAEIWGSGQDAVTGTTPFASWTSRLEVDAGTLCIGSYSYNTISNVDVASGLTQTADDILLFSVALSEVIAPEVVFKLPRRGGLRPRAFAPPGVKTR